jgi:hypothetical protein
MPGPFTIVFVGDIDPNVISVARARGHKLSHFPSWKGFNLDGIDDYIVLYNACELGCPPMSEKFKDAARWRQLWGSNHQVPEDCKRLNEMLEMFAPKPAPQAKQPRIFLVGPADCGISTVAEMLINALPGWGYGPYNPGIPYSERFPLPEIVVTTLKFWQEYRLWNVLHDTDIVVYQGDAPFGTMEMQRHSVGDMKKYGFSATLRMLKEKGIVPNARDVRLACAEAEASAYLHEVKVLKTQLEDAVRLRRSAEDLRDSALVAFDDMSDRVKKLRDEVNKLTA